MDFEVLGPLSVRHNGVDLVPTAPKQRQMIALLLLTPGHMVSTDQFVEELWDANPTPTAVASVHSYVMLLRRTLRDLPGPDGTSRRRLVTVNRTYRLNVRAGELDLDAFEDLGRIGTATLVRGDYALAASQLATALEMCRAPVLPDVIAGPLLRPALASIEATRLRILGQRVWADLNLGRHHELIGELSALSCQHPTNEEYATQLMLAMHRSGRRADALDVFHRLRRSLRDDLGVLPSRRMHELYSDILACHPRLETSSRPPTRMSLDLADAIAS